MSDEYRVDVFFYGSYINFSVLQEAGITERHYEPARLPGYQLVIGPLANLEHDVGSQAFGILTKLSHRELENLYTGHALKKLGGLYLPEAVLVFTYDNAMHPALTYIRHDMAAAKPDSAYVDRIFYPAQEYGFPLDYLRHIESFR